jgi:DNA-binding NtrC family response regulator
MTTAKKLSWKDLARGAPAAARVLVVDDDPTVRKSLEKLVKSFGHDVRSAGSAEEGDHWLAAERFDLMLLDIELPRMKGIEFLPWALERDGEMAVIMLTGLDDPDLAIQCIDQGARTYLVKPIEAEFLRLALKDSLTMRALLVERNRAAG